MRRIAVLTSGGGAPGSGTAIRAAVRAGRAAGAQTFGVRGGFAGLIAGAFTGLDPDTTTDAGVAAVAGGGRSQAFRTSEGRRQAIAHLDLEGVEGVVVIGGDGSLRGADALSRECGVGVVGVPATIRNDLSGTAASVGFDTAANRALAAVDRALATAGGGQRLLLVTVAEPRASWIAATCALAAGATAVVLPERAVDVASLRRRVRETLAREAATCLVVLAAGPHDDAGDVAAAIAGEPGAVDHRLAVVGDLATDGPPSVRDRALGTALGESAVRALLDGEDRVMVGERDGEVTPCPLQRAWAPRAAELERLCDLVDRLAPGGGRLPG